MICARRFRPHFRIAPFDTGSISATHDVIDIVFFGVFKDCSGRLSRLKDRFCHTYLKSC